MYALNNTFWIVPYNRPCFQKLSFWTCHEGYKQRTQITSTEGLVCVTFFYVSFFSLLPTWRWLRMLNGKIYRVEEFPHSSHLSIHSDFIYKKRTFITRGNEHPCLFKWSSTPLQVMRNVKTLGNEHSNSNSNLCQHGRGKRSYDRRKHQVFFFFLHTEDTYEVYIADTQFPVMLKFESNV